MDPINGLIVIDKPAGPTSHDIVAAMRRTLGSTRVGHTGTLDPMATGVLPLVVGSATRLAQFLTARDKRYDARIRLGLETDSYDHTGRAVGPEWTGAWPDRAAIARALDAFRGTFVQEPPAYSAKRIQGVRSHTIARRASKGSAAVEAPVRPRAVTVTVSRLTVLEWSGSDVRLDIECSAGFYVRSLAHDLGVRLGTGAHLTSLRRTASGSLTLQDAVEFAAVVDRRDAAHAALVPLSRMLPEFPAVQLTPEGVRRAVHGRELGPSDGRAGWPLVTQLMPAVERIRLLDDTGDLVGLAVPTAVAGVLHPSLVLK